MTIVFDLDGTLIDSSERLFQLFRRLVPQSSLTKNEYWELKRNKINHKMLLELKYPEVDFDTFNNDWMSSIEKDELLQMDILFYDTINTLKKLSDRYVLLLLTARQSRDGLERELKRLEIKKYFDTILVTEGKTTKENLLKEYIETNQMLIDINDLFVSDMGSDIVLGKKYGYTTVAITHGFMNKNKLSEYAPDIIINDLNCLTYKLNSND